MSDPVDPATRDRIFRIASPISRRGLSDVMRKVCAEARCVKLEWLCAPRQVYDVAAEGLVDIAHLGGETRLPEGVDVFEVAPFLWTSFFRQRHPAFSKWGPEAWLRYPHVQVSIANDARSPLDNPAADKPRHWTVGALISKFSSLGPLLANSDMNGTFPRIIMAWDMQTYGLRPLLHRSPRQHSARLRQRHHRAAIRFG